MTQNIQIGNFQPTGELHPETAQNLLAKTIKTAGLTPVPTEKKDTILLQKFYENTNLIQTTKNPTGYKLDDIKDKVASIFTKLLNTPG